MRDAKVSAKAKVPGTALQEVATEVHGEGVDIEILEFSR